MSNGWRVSAYLGQVHSRSSWLPIEDHSSNVHAKSRLAQLVERVTSNDEVSRSSRLEGIRTSSQRFLRLCF